MLILDNKIYALPSDEFTIIQYVAPEPLLHYLVMYPHKAINSQSTEITDGDFIQSHLQCGSQENYAFIPIFHTSSLMTFTRFQNVIPIAEILLLSTAIERDMPRVVSDTNQYQFRILSNTKQQDCFDFSKLFPPLTTNYSKTGGIKKLCQQILSLI